MPDRYDYKEDGKLHTRFSELRNCTPGGVARVVENRKYELNTTNPYTQFGTTRHEVFANFILQHQVLPTVVAKQLPGLEIDEDCVERSYAVEVWENVVIHGTPDLHNDTWVADFKTTTKGAINYKNDKQLIFYAWLLNKIGHNITKGYYICERWDADRTQIQGYEVMERDITAEDIEFIDGWAKQRVETLFNELTK